MKLIILAALAATTIGATSARDLRDVTRGAWRVEADTVDSLFRAGRAAISDEAYDRAAQTLHRVYTGWPKSKYASEALYWEAFARYRTGRVSQRQRAEELLERLFDEYPESAIVKGGEPKALATRIRGSLAREGDADAAAAIAEAASASVPALVTGALDAARAGLAIAGTALAGALDSMRSDVAATARASAEADRARAPRAARDPLAPLASLGSTGGPARRADRCADEDDERIEALNALLQMNAESAVPVLKKVMARRDAGSECLRRKAVWLLSQKVRQDETVVDALMDAAQRDPDTEVREQAVFWLSQTRSEKAVTLLEQLLKDGKDEALQKKAMFSLAQSKSPRGYAALREYAASNSANPELRLEAIFWLGQSRDAEHVDFLKKLFPTITDADVQDKILFAVSQNRSQGAWLVEQASNPKLSLERRKQALFWAGQSGGTSVATLGSVYAANTDREMKEQVLFVLSQRRDAAAVDKLMDVARTESDRELRKKAIFWLGQSRDPRAAQFLAELIAK
ncbi:MAG: HEAT repeat domain-containing protein [Gemmatimonadaceae bacterium]|nr:HEAT repeat domain-containing protein [Gemmatimonadaceae bacterium]